MPVTVRDNAAAYLRDLDMQVPRRKSWVSELGNAVDYALFLHNRHGYSVLNDEDWLRKTVLLLTRLVRSSKPFTDAALKKALEGANEDEVRFLQSFTSRFQPPVRRGGAARPAHPGSWADRTTRLAKGYYSTINRGARRRYDYAGPLPFIP